MAALDRPTPAGEEKGPRMVPVSRVINVALALALVASGCAFGASGSASQHGLMTERSPTSRDPRAPVIVAAGDIACSGEPCDGQRATGRLIRAIDPRAVLVLGDAQYDHGEYEDFLASYDVTWGRSFDITRPVPGNHEYEVVGASGYFRYFGKRAHPGAGGTYGFDAGSWHLIAIDSGPGVISDEQLDRVREDLRADDHLCELAYWHHPRWSSGVPHGSDTAFDALWRILYGSGVDVVLNGHEHSYERFAPLAPSGRPDPRRGIRQFVVGTGGRSLYAFGDPIPGSLVRISRYGVLRMVLRPRSYGWAFVAVDGTAEDRGRATCHG